ncbi:MAG: XdhC/CoxI family protein [Proteobacteria bacterium]|nr:XdhC/CoxI family protein [Pseudomonadota bacterium]
MKTLVQSIVQLLEQEEDLVMATIIAQEGSTPRGSGTKIVVRKNGEFFGTIGGGLFEASILEAAPGVFETGGAVVRTFEMTAEQLTPTSMVCGGRVEVLIEHIVASPDNIEVFRAAERALKERKRSALITDLGPTPNKTADVRRCLVMDDQSTYGNVPHPSSRLDALLEKASETPHPVMLPIEDLHFRIEPVFFPAGLFLFGAGHVSKPTAALGTTVGFHTVVIDDREEFANRERFPDSAEVKVVADFKDCFAELDVDRDSYLVIVTRGHLHDKIVLAQALKTRAGYIGMIGSRRKRDTVYQALLDEGFTREDLERVHCPVGLEIGSESPEEIAVSIMAELIQVRSRKDN